MPYVEEEADPEVVSNTVNRAFATAEETHAAPTENGGSEYV